MARPKNPVPAYKLHKPSGQARVRINGRDIYLGRHGSSDSKSEYERVCAEPRTTFAAAISTGNSPVVGRRGVSLNEIRIAFLDHAENHYRRPDGSLTNEIKEYKLVTRRKSRKEV